MKSQQLKAFIHSYINDPMNPPPYNLSHFRDAYSKEFCVDISYLDISTVYIRLSEDDIDKAASITKTEITFDMLLQGIAQGYLDNRTIDKLNIETLSPVKQKFTAKQIIIGIFVVIVSSILLGIIAIYT